MSRRCRLCRTRLAFLVGALAAAHLVVLWRLADLQLVRADELRVRAQRQHQRTVKLDPIRGPIYERNGRELAMSLDVFSIYADPSDLRSEAAFSLKIAEAVLHPAILERVERDDGQPPPRG